MGNEWMYSYEVVFLRNEDVREAKGIVSGYSFKEVMMKLERYYGADNIYQSAVMIINNSDGGVYEWKEEARPDGIN